MSGEDTFPAAMQPVPSPVHMVHADAHFRMGSAHLREGTPCQDYAGAGQTASGLPYAVVSDGCSSSGRTDLGARLLVLCADKALKSSDGPVDLRGLPVRVRDQAIQIGAMLDLGTADMDATLGVAVATPGGGAAALLMGDGVAVARMAGCFDVRILDWAGNMPGYPCYAATEGQRDLFIRQSREAAAAEGRACCSLTRWLVGEDATPAQVSRQDMDAADGLEGIVLEWTAADGVDSLSVATDGILQVRGVAWPAAVAALCGYKAARTGQFVHRRVGRALSAWARDGHGPVDDLGVASVAAAAEGA